MRQGVKKVSDEKNARIVEFALKNPDIPMAQIATQFGVSPAHVKNQLKKAGVDVQVRTKAMRGTSLRKALKGTGQKWSGPFFPRKPDQASPDDDSEEEEE